MESISERDSEYSDNKKVKSMKNADLMVPKRILPLELSKDEVSRELDNDQMQSLEDYYGSYNNRTTCSAMIKEGMLSMPKLEKKMLFFDSMQANVSNSQTGKFGTAASNRPDFKQLVHENKTPKAWRTKFREVPTPSPFEARAN